MLKSVKSARCFCYFKFCTFCEYFRWFWASAQILRYICKMILENSMLSKDKLLYLPEKESISSLINGKRYKGLKNDISHEFGEFSQNPNFFQYLSKKLRFSWILDVMTVSKSKISWNKGKRTPLTKILDFYKAQMLNKIHSGFLHISIISWHFR